MSRTKAGYCTLILYLCIGTWLFPLRFAFAAENEKSIAALIENGGFIFSSGGSIAGQLNSNSLYIPASIIKIATALAALELLGPSYHYKTEFYIKDQATLYIKGYGDPFLTSEHIRNIAGIIKNSGITRIDRIVIDGSSFSVPTMADGAEMSDNPYDVPNGGLAVNFNSLSIQVNNDRSVSSGEPQTPLLPLTRLIGAQLKPGSHRVNVSAFGPGRIADNSQRYAAELFAAFLRRAGINIGTAFESKPIDSSCALIHTFISPKSIRELVRDCLQFSNNFIANQLFLSCGAVLYGYPATWEKSRRALRQVLTEHFFIENREFEIREGSGLSRRTKVTPLFMLEVLEAFRPYRNLLPAKDDMYIKSGTLTGVYCYAGYFNTSEISDPFVIMLNQRRNTRQAILNTLHRRYRQAKPVNH